jgi:hypothetical protein
MEHKFGRYVRGGSMSSVVYNEKIGSLEHMWDGFPNFNMIHRNRLYTLLNELGFPSDEYSTDDIEQFIKKLSEFVKLLNDTYEIYLDSDLTEDFSVMTLHEPWFTNFLIAANDLKSKNQKEQK